MGYGRDGIEPVEKPKPQPHIVCEGCGQGFYKKPNAKTPTHCTPCRYREKEIVLKQQQEKRRIRR